MKNYVDLFTDLPAAGIAITNPLMLRYRLSQSDCWTREFVCMALEGRKIGIRIRRPDGMSDEQLRQILNGFGFDDEEMERLVSNIGLWWWRYSRRLSMNKEQIEKELQESFISFAKEYPESAMSLIAGLFVGLLEFSVEEAGGDGSKEIKIDGCGGRDITISANPLVMRAD